MRIYKKNHKVIIFRGSLNNKLKGVIVLKNLIVIERIIDGDDVLFDFKLYKEF